MEKFEYKNIYRLEGKHWWYKGIRLITFSILNKYIQNKNLKILDAGCGTGYNLTILKRYGDVTGIDFSDEAIKYCKKRKLEVHNVSVENLKFKDNSFDLVTSFEVLYHKGVKDDLKALKEIYRVLKKQGLMLIRVPAYDFLYSGHDVIVHTKRRYTKNELRNKIEKVGFKVERITYINTFLFPIIAILRLINRNKESTSDLKPLSNFINDFLFFVIRSEEIFLRKINFPFGVSILCLAKKS